MPHLLLFGPGYCGRAIANALVAEGWEVTPVRRATPHAEVRAAIGRASHVLSTVPPEGGADQVLAAHGAALAASGAWLGYLSSTGVYGDAGGAWLDESAPLEGRRVERIAADRAWGALGARVLRLAGIYGPGRSVLERIAGGRAHRIDLPGHVFSRVHRDDIVSGVRAAIAHGPAGAYNLSDDLPASQNLLVEEACRLLGLSPPPLLAPDDAALSPATRAYYGESRRVAAGKAHRLLGWRPHYPSFREGLRAVIASASPATASSAPAAASPLQR